jgi:NAD+ kinase
MLDIFVIRQGAQAAQFNCLNDAVVSASGIAKLIRLKAFFKQGESEYTELGSYRSDGLIVATATGSTAYSMAAGGPLLDPEMEAVILNPICPFTLSNRPLVLPSRQTLALSVAEEQRSGVLLTVDGQDTFALEPGDRIIIDQAPYKAVLISYGKDAYYTALRTKLSQPENNYGESNA